jgi:hypothetical protein
MIRKKRADRVRAYREGAFGPAPRLEERPLKSELLKREIAGLDARIEAARQAAEEARVTPEEKERKELARQLRLVLAEEARAHLMKQAREAREHAGVVEKQAVKVDHALQGFLKEYLKFKDDLEHARRKAWVPWTTAATTVCNRALKTALQPIPEFEIRPLGHEERKCFSEIGLSLGDAVRGAAVRLERDIQVTMPEPAAAKPNGEKTERKRIDPRELGVDVYDSRDAADKAHRAAMAGPGGKL